MVELNIIEIVKRERALQQQWRNIAIATKTYYSIEDGYGVRQTLNLYFIFLKDLFFYYLYIIIHDLKLTIFLLE